MSINHVKRLLAVICFILTMQIISSTCHAVRFRDDISEENLKRSAELSIQIPHGSNAVYINIDDAQLSGWALNSKTVITCAHDLKELSLNEAYVTNEPIVDRKNPKNISYIEKIIFHPTYNEIKYIPNQYSLNLSDIDNPDIRIGQARYLLGTKKGFEYRGIDLAILHLKNPIKITKPLSLFDPDKISEKGMSSTLYSYGIRGKSDGEEIDTKHQRVRHLGVLQIYFSSKHKVLFSKHTSQGGVFNKLYYDNSSHQLFSRTNKGDSGGGLVATDPLDSNKKLLGIVSRSTRLSSDGNNSLKKHNNNKIPNFDIFTPVFLHKDWIQKNIKEE